MSTDRDWYSAWMDMTAAHWAMSPSAMPYIVMAYIVMAHWAMSLQQCRFVCVDIGADMCIGMCIGMWMDTAAACRAMFINNK